MLDCVTLPAPANQARASVIWLHGLGADGNDFVPIVPELGLGADHSVRFIFPHAPIQPVTLNGGMQMPAWYDIMGADLADKQDRQGIQDSAQAIEALIAQEINQGIPSQNIILAGFSQGGAIALHTGIRHQRPLGGIIALSTYLPLHEQLATEASPANQGLPIFMAHGTQDPVVPLNLGQLSRDYLTNAGYQLSWHDYAMEHEVCPAEIQALGRWLRDRLGLSS